MKTLRFALFSLILAGAGTAVSVSAGEAPVTWQSADAILARPAVKRGRMVNRMSGEPSEQLRERHDADDFETRTHDKLAGAQS